MSAEPAITRMKASSRALPARILLVDDDELERELMADRLKSAGFEVTAAANGSEALSLLERQWYPLLVTDRQMPVLDGIELTERLRARGVDDTYVIMLTVRDAGLDYERGYLAGVDDYLTKKLPDAELLARVQKGFATLALRRSLKEAQAELANQGQLEPCSGAYTSEHLQAALRSECRRAERYGRSVGVMTVAVATNHPGEAAQPLPDDELRLVVDTLRAAVRAHVDWIARTDSLDAEPTLAVVLPEAGTADAVAIKSRLHSALRAMTAAARADASCLPDLRFSFGFASLDQAHTQRASVEASALVSVAEQCRACLQTRGRSQLTAVQRSVAEGVAICCRHGYAVESHCHFMGESQLPRAVEADTP